MVFSETIHAMLLTHDKFREFTPKAISDAKKTSEVLVAISAESRAEVDAITEKAGAAGGRMDPGPKQEHGSMYGRCVRGPGWAHLGGVLDGHGGGRGRVVGQAVRILSPHA